MLLVFYFHAVAARSVAGHYLGVRGEIPITDSVAKLIIANGFTGVALFFGLSGFIFTWGALHSQRIRWRGFYLNRFLRIFPLYALVNLIAFFSQHGRMPLAQLAFNLIGFGNFHLGYGIFDIVLWTISLEIQFYLLFPYLMVAIRRWGVKFPWLVVGAMLLLRLFARLQGPYIHDLVYWTLFGRLDQFLIGMILACYANSHNWLNGDLLKSSAISKLIPGLIASASALVLLLWAYISTGWKYGDSYFLVVWPTLEALSWAAIAVCYVGLARHYQPKWLKPLQIVGVISFSLYILQYPIIKSLQQSGWVINIHGHKLASGILSATLIALPITLLISGVTYLLIEKPPLKLRKLYAG